MEKKIKKIKHVLSISAACRASSLVGFRSLSWWQSLYEATYIGYEPKFKKLKHTLGFSSEVKQQREFMLKEALKREFAMEKQLGEFYKYFKQANFGTGSMVTDIVLHRNEKQLGLVCRQDKYGALFSADVIYNLASLPILFNPNINHAISAVTPNAKGQHGWWEIDPHQKHPKYRISGLLPNGDIGYPDRVDLTLVKDPVMFFELNRVAHQHNDFYMEELMPGVRFRHKTDFSSLPQPDGLKFNVYLDQLEDIKQVQVNSTEKDEFTRFFELWPEIPFYPYQPIFFGFADFDTPGNPFAVYAAEPIPHNEEEVRVFNSYNSGLSGADWFKNLYKNRLLITPELDREHGGVFSRFCAYYDAYYSPEVYYEFDVELKNRVSGWSLRLPKLLLRLFVWA